MPSVSAAEFPIYITPCSESAKHLFLPPPPPHQNVDTYSLLFTFLKGVYLSRMNTS